MSEAKLDDLTLDEALDARTALIALKDSQGWKILVRLWEQDMQVQRNMFARPIRDNFELYAQEFTKGAVAQIASDIALPSQLIDILNAQIEMHPANKEQPNVTSPSDDPEEAGRDGGSRAP